MLLKFKTFRTSKGKLLRKLKPMRKEQLAQQINPIVARQRGIDEKEAGYQKFLRSDEVIVFLKKIGESLEDHGREVELLTHQMDKTKLRLTFPKLSTPDFSKTINEIICSERSIPKSEAVRKRYLYPSEINSFLEVIGEVFGDELTTE